LPKKALFIYSSEKNSLGNVNTDFKKFKRLLIL